MVKAIITVAVLLALWHQSTTMSAPIEDRDLRIIRKFSNYAVYITTFPQKFSGTGLLYTGPKPEDARTFTLITAKHVFDSADSLELAIQETDSAGVFIDLLIRRFPLNSPSKGVPKVPLFVSHDSLDLVALFIGKLSDVSRKDQSLTSFTIRKENLLPLNEVMIGQSVLFFGYPSSLTSKGGRPLVRSGIIAGIRSSEAERATPDMVYLDAQVFRGSSGSPVFLSPAEDYDSTKYFVGVVAGYIPVENYVILDMIYNTRMPITENSGIGVIVPANDIAVLAERAKARFFELQSQ